MLCGNPPQTVILKEFQRLKDLAVIDGVAVRR
jgi:hypothetical protein